MDIFDIELLQELQDAFHDTTGIAVGISDLDGVPITQHCSGNAFCTEFNKKSPIGCARCQECDSRGLERAIREKKTVTYVCHAGLIDFAAPIVVNGKAMGGFLGGQVREAPLDEERILKYAEEIGVDPVAYLEAARQIPYLERSRIESAADFLVATGNVVSHMAYNKYHTMMESVEIEREANMKSDFLANMSHEIRTPMNAITGMAEMALREDLPPDARDYVNQIKAAGNTLLTIINDILDFSKIESGKMDINMCEYDPAEVIYDITNIIMTRIGNKNLDLVIDYPPDIPKQLMGDNIRIKQVIINLANNAVKFTKEGMVKLSVHFTKLSGRVILLKVSVQDTGIGIKEEDRGKLFQSFQQLDSKRNRNIEGSGLGLAISKQLISLMNGKISLESEYGVGSTFSFELPQIVLEDSASVSDVKQAGVKVIVLSANSNINESLRKDFERFGVDCNFVSNEEGLDEYEENRPDFLFIDHPLFDDSVYGYVAECPQMSAVLMVDFSASVEYDLPNLQVVKKPLYALNIPAIFNHEDIRKNWNQSSDENIDFIAPEADILIVDDNQVNLTVAQGLMKPLEMKIDTALSGKEAIDKISVKHYDLLFMDHMMPELDGIETTHIIRRFHQEYNDVPIIALTANVMEEMRAMFLCEGMNDFLAKPIEMRVLVAKLKRWLPKEKIQKVNHDRKHAKEEVENNLPEIEGLDTSLALSYLGTEDLFWDVIKDFYHVTEKKAELIEKYTEEKDWQNYTIEVHALKSAARQIGAAHLSKCAAALEQAGKDEEEELILPNTVALLKEYRHLKDVLEPYCQEEEKEGKERINASPEILQEIFERLGTAMNNLDMDGMDSAAEELDNYTYEPEQAEIFEKLRSAVEDMDIDTCEVLIDEWKKLL